MRDHFRPDWKTQKSRTEGTGPATDGVVLITLFRAESWGSRGDPNRLYFPRGNEMILAPNLLSYRPARVIDSFPAWVRDDTLKDCAGIPVFSVVFWFRHLTVRETHSTVDQLLR